MSQKAEKPTLSGQRLKTRKRDEKEKYDPSNFRDALVKGLNETDTNNGTNLEPISRYLDTAGNRLDYRRYSDVLFDILFAGGLLAPGGSIVGGTDEECRTAICVFTCEDDIESLRRYYDVFIRLIRRYQYLEKAFEAALTKVLPLYFRIYNMANTATHTSMLYSMWMIILLIGCYYDVFIRLVTHYQYLEKLFEESLTKIVTFLRGFKPEERSRLAKFTSLLLANGFCTAKVLTPLFDEHLVKEGIALTFATTLFKTWLQEKDVNSVYSMLKKANLETKLMELLPVNKRSLTNVQTYFNEQGLEPIAEMVRVQALCEQKKELQKSLKEMLMEVRPAKEIVAFIADQTQTNSLPEHEVVVLVWNTLMAAVEWNKKDELVAEQALKHLRSNIAVLTANCKMRKSEMALIAKVQEYCYENMNFMKVFHKIVKLFYKADVLSEDAIIRWYKTDHSAKGKSVFLEQIKVFVEWLENAEEESGEEEGPE